ncbi:MAG: autotransporter-associated beta strand repeat-containing protein [Verrucomicrobiota bacterium]
MNTNPHISSTPSAKESRHRTFLPAVIAGLVLIALAPAASAIDFIWDGTTSDLWSEELNWDQDFFTPISGDTAIFDNTSPNLVINLEAFQTVDRLFFNTANVPSYTIGTGAPGTDTIVLASNGATQNVELDETVTTDQTIAANILLGENAAGDDTSFDVDTTFATLFITGNIDTSAGGVPGVKRLEFGDFNTTNIGNIVITGDISNTGGATRFDTFVAGANVTMTGDVEQTGGNTQRTIIRDDGILTVNGTGTIGQGNFEVRYGTANFNNTTEVQFFDNTFNLGSADQGNGNATINIAPGATIEVDGNINYVADDDTANTATISGGTIDLSDVARNYSIADNTLVAGPELTFASTLKGNGDENATSEDFNFIGPGTLFWDGDFDTSGIVGSVTETSVGEFVDILFFQNGKTIVGPNGTDFTGLRRTVAVRQRNNASFSDFPVEFDINGQEVLLDDDLVIGQFNNTSVVSKQPIHISDSADSPTSKIRLTDDNDIVYNDGENNGDGNFDNSAATIDADLQFEGSAFTFAVQDSTVAAADLIVNGTITDDNSGGRNLTKSNPGTLLLTATDNLYNVLQINDGTVQVTNLGALGDNDIQIGNNTTDGTFEYTGPEATITLGTPVRIGDNNGTVGTRVGDGGITNNGSGTLTFSATPFNDDRTAAMTDRTITFDGTSDIVVSGALVDNSPGAKVSLIKSGTNTVTLGGTNTYTGTTVVNAGCLEVTGSLDAASAVTVADGACLSGSGTIAGTVTLGTTPAGITLELDGTDGGLTFDSAVDTSNGVTVNISGTAGGTVTVLTYDNTEANNINVAHFTLGTSPPVGPRGAGGFVDTGSAIVISLGFEDNSWTGTDVTNPTFWDITVTPNWSNSTDSVFFEGDNAIFGDTASNFNPTLQEDITVNNVNFTSTDTLNDYTIDGTTFTLTVNGVLNVAAGDAIGSDDGNDIVINTIIGGAGSVLVGDGDTVQDNAANSVTLNAANTYTGGTTLQEGNTAITNSGALGTGDVTMEEISNTGSESRDPILNLDADGLDIANNFTIGNTGTKIIRLDNGGITANTGTLSGDITNNETGDLNFRLEPGRNDTLTVSGQISGAALLTRSLNQAEQGTVVLGNASNDFTGNLVVAAIVEVASIGNAGVPSHAGAGSLLVLGNSANATPTNNNNQEGNLTYTGGAASTDKQVQVGNYWFLPGHNGIFGGSIVNNGTGGLVFTNSAFNVQESRVAADIGPRPLRLRGTYTGVSEIDGVIQDNAASDAFVDETVSVEVDTSGTWQLDGANTYTGPTTVTAGTLLVNGSIAASSDVTVNGGTLGGTGTISGTVFAGAAGNVAPGTSPGTLTIDGDFDATALASGSGQLEFELDALAGTNDLISVGGTFSIGSGALGIGDISTTNLGGVEVGTYTLVSASTLIGTLDGTDTSGTLGSFTTTLQIAGNDLELVVASAAADPFDTWAAANGLDGTPGKENGRGDDPDNDGATNGEEFALNGDPLSPTNNGLLAELVQDASAPAGEELTLIIAVRDGASFTSSGTTPNIVQTATVDGVTYTIQGATAAVFPTADVSAVSGPSDTAPAGAGLPDLTGTEWEYHTFKLDISEPTVTGETGQIRVELNF